MVSEGTAGEEVERIMYVRQKRLRLRVVHCGVRFVRVHICCCVGACLATYGGLCAPQDTLHVAELEVVLGQS
jgi:hypothetical protein